MCALPGNTPLLVPRPLMEHFGLVVDFGSNRLQWDKVWAPVRESSGGGHYLLTPSGHNSCAILFVVFSAWRLGMEYYNASHQAPGSGGSLASFG